MDSESLPDDDRNDMEIVLNYVAQDDLTENLKNKILDFGNLFELADKNNAVDFFNNIKVDEKIAHRIIKKLQFLKAREKMTKFLFKENIPVDRIDYLIRCVCCKKLWHDRLFNATTNRMDIRYDPVFNRQRELLYQYGIS